MGYTTEERLRFAKDVKEMGENLDITVDEGVLETYRDGRWLNQPSMNAFDHELAILALWKNLDAFISKQVEEIKKVQAKAADATIHVGADGHCDHHGQDTPYLKVLMGTLDGEPEYEILCVRCIAHFLSHHTEECAAHIGPITFEAEEQSFPAKGEHHFPNSIDVNN